MVKTISSCAAAQHKPVDRDIPVNSPPLINGVVVHEAVSPSLQVAVLGIVDQNVLVPLSEIIRSLAGTANVEAAILALADAHILELHLVDGILDHRTLVSRACRATTAVLPAGPADDAPVLEAPVGPVDTTEAGRDSEEGLFSLPIAALSPLVILGSGSKRRKFARHAALQRPGAYILFNKAGHYYVGFSNSVGVRIAQGNQPIDNVSGIIAVTDRNGLLDRSDAKVLERCLWSRMTMSQLTSLNGDAPEGSAISPERYSELDGFAARVCLALHQQDLVFGHLTPRQILAGPRDEPDHLAKKRAYDGPPKGEILEIEFGRLRAFAARQEDHWLLLRGSEVRINTAPSANKLTAFRRAAFLHNGQLRLSADGKSYIVCRDIAFPSGSAVAQFCCGSKGRKLDAWHPTAPDGGFDPDTPSLIAG